MKLLEATQHRCELQQKVIDNQEKQISNLTEINGVLEKQVLSLTEKVQSLSESLDKASEIVEQQQALLDAVFSEQNI